MAQVQAEKRQGDVLIATGWIPISYTSHVGHKGYTNLFNCYNGDRIWNQYCIDFSSVRQIKYFVMIVNTSYLVNMFYNYYFYKQL